MWQPQGLYNQYVLRTPVLLSGVESVRGLYHYPGAKIAVIHGKTFFDQTLFLSTFAKKEVRFFERSWDEEPDFDNIAETLAQLEEYRPDVIIAVGGGSVIDGGKLCRLLYEIPSYQLGKTRISGVVLKTKFIAIPTTVGSGAEVSSAAVFVNRQMHRKDMIVIHELQPDVVVYDPRYVEKTPKRLLVSSALDAMAHLLEGYVSNVENIMMDVLAEKGIAILREELSKLLLSRAEKIDYTRLQYAGYLGGLVQNHCIVGAAHAVAHQLTDAGYSHGEAVTLLLPAVVEQNSESKNIAERYEKVAKAAGFADAKLLIGMIRELCEQSGIAEQKEMLKEQLRRFLEEEGSGAGFIERIQNDKGGKGNPIEMTEQYIKALTERI